MQSSTTSEKRTVLPKKYRWKIWILNRYIKLTEHERSQIIHSLIDKNNAFMAKSRYTDAVGEVILKLMKAKKKAFIK